MSDLDALYAQAQDEAVDGLMKARFRCDPVTDRSGLLGQPSGTPPADASEDDQFDAFMSRHFPGSVAVAPQPVPPEVPGAPTMPELHQGPRGAAPDDDAAMLDAYMRTFFPGSVG